MKIEIVGSEFVITDFNEVEAWKIACKMEKDGIDFYHMLLGAVHDPDAKLVFEFMLDEEKLHLQSFMNKLEEMRQVPGEEFEDDNLLSCLEYCDFWAFIDAKSADKVITDVTIALEVGIKTEEDAIRFYETCLQHVASDGTKDALLQIIIEEKAHKNKLEAMLYGT